MQGRHKLVTRGAEASLPTREQPGLSAGLLDYTGRLTAAMPLLVATYTCRLSTTGR
jgi:hypothetical protein